MRRTSCTKSLAVLLLIGAFFQLVRPFTVAAQEVWDPLEPMNRGIFWFNDKVDIYVLEPVARGYDKVTPKTVQRKVDNFFTNLRYPSFLVSDVIQLKFGQAFVHTGRFVVNSTVGILGLFDPAADLGLQFHEEDFGTALGYHGVPEGFYLVIPLLGPSNARDAVGRVADSFLDPTYYLSYTDISNEAEWAIIIGSKALNLVNTRASLLDAVKSAKEASLDYYLFVQSAYHQRRQNLIYDNNPPEEAPPGEEEAPPGEEPGSHIEP